MSRWWLVALGALLTAAVLTSGLSADPATPSPDASPFACPITQPNGNEPPPEANVFARGAGDYGNDVLWTALWIWGEGVVQVPDDDRLLPDGTITGMKWGWYRYVAGKLLIEGRRLDASAPPLEADGDGGNGPAGSFRPTSLTFPTDGCWEITGSIEGRGSLTFVVLVVYPDGFTPLATPEPRATPA